MYNAAYNCYSECLSLVDVKNSGTSQYQEAKELLKNIWSHLYNGAAYYQQKSASSSLDFAKAYVDMPNLPAFSRDALPRGVQYSNIAYVAASGSFNSRDYNSAIKYSKIYLESGGTDRKKDIMKCMATSYMKLGDPRSALKVLSDAHTAYPKDFDICASAINASMDCGDNVALQKYLDAAQRIKPDDVGILNIQGKLYEDTGDYMKAYSTFSKLQSLRPRNLDVAKHLARNCYNLGVFYYNKNLETADRKLASKYLTTSKEYFKKAVPTFNDILAVEPSSLEFLESLASIYLCINEPAKLETVNARIRSCGGTPVKLSSIPSFIAADGNRAQAVQRRQVQTVDVTPVVAEQQSAVSSTTASFNTTPKYSEYAKTYVEQRLEEWQKKDPYETISEYKQRVTESKRDAKVNELLSQAEKAYIATYADNLKLHDMVLRPYDAEHEVFLAESAYGELIIPVPRANNEARIFESNWNGIQYRGPKYKIINDEITLIGLSFVTPTGRVYHYDGGKSMEYSQTHVDIAFKDIDYGQFTSTASSAPAKNNYTTNSVSVGASDVDVNIPLSKAVNPKTFAVIIANENYEAVADVPMALNDGKVFAEYCQRALGLPKENIRYYENASYGIMLGAIKDIKDISSAYADSDMNVIFYYSGHGIPDESSRDGYLLPVDADGRQMEVCYSLSRLYSELGSLQAENVTVFMDACFSGAKRDGDVIIAARGVALKPKQAAPSGNMVIFSAASGDETAFPYTEKQHGLFTYYLLKKLQESEGNATLGELSEYLIENVKRQSVIVNHKSQTPTVAVSFRMAETWKDLKLKKKK